MRQFLPVANVFSVILLLFALALTAPIVVSLLFDDGMARAFGGAVFIVLVSGLVLNLASRSWRRALQPRDGFLLVSLSWVMLPAFAALPFVFVNPGMSYADAYFEAVSGLTTTGGTVMSGLDSLPESINFWRHFLQWLGGMGILVLAVAILPLLGIGGTQIYKAETPGPMKDSRLTPRIAETAKGLYQIYFLLSLLCLLAYRWAGMTWLDAWCHMFSTVSLGGFSTHDASFGHFDSPMIEALAVVFMLIAGLNFATHFLAFRRRSLRPYTAEPEARWYLGLILGSVLLVAIYLMEHGVYTDFGAAFRHAAFNVISVATTTGYSSLDYSLWPAFAPALMLLLSGFACCAGSTGGGIKMIRAVLLFRQAKRELLRILHPQVVNPVRLGGAVIENNVIFAVLAFMLMYGASLIFFTMVLIFSGLELVTAFSAVYASLNNLGPGLGQVGPGTTFEGLSDFQTWVCSAAMLLGRLELFTLLVLFTPAFWRK